MNDLATLARMIENLIRFGTIAEVQMKPPRVRIKTGSLTTGWLPGLRCALAQMLIGTRPQPTNKSFFSALPASWPTRL